MHASIFKRIRWGLALGLLALVAAAVGSPGLGARAAVPTTGVICTSNGSSTFTITAKAGYISTPDGNTIYMWSYDDGLGNFQHPGPVLCVNKGATVTIVLKNTLPEATSLIFPGQENVMANGAPATPQFDVNNKLTSLAQVAAAGNGSVTYSFVADQPGTYIYESGTDPEKQIQMGLFGALIVRPSLGANYAYESASTKFNPAAEYVMLLSEIDPALHQAVEQHRTYDTTAIHPRYWLINGRSFPDTIADNAAPWLPAQPYGAMVHIRPRNTAAGVDNYPDPALVRYLNVGSRNHPFHPHGNSGRVIARDGRLLQGPANADLSYDKFLVLVGSNQTWDATYDWSDVEHWTPGTSGNNIPVPVPPQQDLTYKDGATWFSGSPYLGYQDDLPNGTVSYNECGEYYHVWHSHALNEAANYDTGFGGMFTLERIDPPISVQTSTGHTCTP
jgi:FtsP/CotA-like multicopper oxidase with cupredoxin domain